MFGNETIPIPNIGCRTRGFRVDGLWKCSKLSTLTASAAAAIVDN